MSIWFHLYLIWKVLPIIKAYQVGKSVVVLLYNQNLISKVTILLHIEQTRKPASRVFLAPPEGLTKFLSSLYHAWQLLLAKFFDLVKLEFWPPGPPSPLGVRGQIWIAYSLLRYMKVIPYQFGLATMSGFLDHLWLI